MAENDSGMNMETTSDGLLIKKKKMSHISQKASVSTELNMESPSTSTVDLVEIAAPTTVTSVKITKAVSRSEEATRNMVSFFSFFPCLRISN